MPDAFETALEFVLKWEGGLSDHVHDRGGKTKYGISKNAYPRLDIENLTLEEAKEIYRRDYWRPLRGDQLPLVLAVISFDFAVNSGVHRATKALQKHVGVRADGVVGPVTVGAARMCDISETVPLLLQDRISFLFWLANQDPDQFQFLRGWVNRVSSLAFLAGTLS